MQKRWNGLVSHLWRTAKFTEPLLPLLQRGEESGKEQTRTIRIARTTTTTTTTTTEEAGVRCCMGCHDQVYTAIWKRRGFQDAPASKFGQRFNS
jgi:hypothetical protein